MEINYNPCEDPLICFALSFPIDICHVTQSIADNCAFPAEAAIGYTFTRKEYP